MKKILLIFFLLYSISSLKAQEGPSNGSRLASLSLLSGGGTNAGGASVQADEFSGSANYSIPIPVPPARGSITPSLTINYNSHRRNMNGWVGYGWELELGAINRSPGAFGIDYRNGQDFEVRLNGQTETLQKIREGVDAVSFGVSLPTGYVLDLYQAKIENAFTYYLFSHLRGNQSVQQGWIAIDKSGVRYYFGRAFNSRDVPGTDTGGMSSNEIYGWKLDQVMDPNGNLLSIEYDSNHLPTHVRYQDVDIVFRQNPLLSSDGQAYFPMFREAFRTRDLLASMLNAIEIYRGGTRLQKVSFSYQTSATRRVRYLSSIQQFGRTDAESLPQTSFNYFGEEGFSFSNTSYVRQSSRMAGGRYQSGWTNEDVTFADMNGDGLVDQVMANPDATFEVYFNNGNDFVEIPGRSHWTDPFSAWPHPGYDDAPWAGKLTASRHGHQWLFLIDMNGDGLPDRMGRSLVRDIGSSNETAQFWIAFNNGHGWDRPVAWADPFVGGWAGTSDIDKGFYDMNGDGLVDRVVGDRSPDSATLDRLGVHDTGRFLIFYNTGYSFRSVPEYWVDPITSYRRDHSERAHLFASDDENTYLLIRDLNGDGLPDRIFRNRLLNGSTFLGYGFAVSMNTGHGWALPRSDPARPDTVFLDGFDNLGILDNVSDEDSRGYINKQHDLIDVNGDSFLDRVESARTDSSHCELRFSIYRGLSRTDSFAQLSSPIITSDPLSDDPVDFRDISTPSGEMRRVPIGQWAACGYLDNENDDNHYVFFQDFNGDHIPDRLALTRRHNGLNSRDGNNTYQFYPLLLNAITFHDNPTWWRHQQANQPIGALKEIHDGQGADMAIEYLPSTWPVVLGQPNHWFLPFNMNLVHKIYTQDPTLSMAARTSTFPEILRHPGMRWMTYWFRGGNNYILHGRPDRDPYSRFNGFQESKKINEPLPGDSWSPIVTTNYYSQAVGDVNPLSEADRLRFDLVGLNGHFALSGKGYKQTVVENGVEKVRQESLYRINAAGSSNFDCAPDSFTHVAQCYPRSITTSKSILETPGTPLKLSRVDFAYDDLGNITSESSFDRRGRLLLKKETQFYPASRFGSFLIRDRPSHQVKKGSDEVVWREKTFDYDSRGNPILETSFVTRDGTQTLSTTRRFNSLGNLESITDSDGVTKTISYESQQLFPAYETIRIPTGADLTTSREFNPLNGEILSEIGPQGAGKWLHQDAFGRKIEDGVQDTSHHQTTLTRYRYDYVDVTLDGWEHVTLLKSQTWAPQTNFPITNTVPSEIVYADPSGKPLQKCSLTERGNYRLIQNRMRDGGRLEVETEPVFADSCEFLPLVSPSARLIKSHKDFFGRNIFIETPPGDVTSPVNTIRISYRTNALGQLEKTSTDSMGRSYVEVIDDTEKVVEIRDPEGSVIRYAYNPVEDLLDVTTGTGSLLTHIDYDLLGRKVGMTDADMGHWTYDYDNRGRLEWQADNAGQKIHNTYDSIGRLKKKEFFQRDRSLERTEIYTYDTGEGGYDIRPGELFQVDEYAGVSSQLRRTRFSYDPLFRRNSRLSRFIPRLAEFHQDLEYDVRGRTTRIINPGGSSLRYEYMLTGVLSKVCGTACDASGEIYYHLDPANAFDTYGALVHEQYGNGVVGDYDYYPNSHRLKEKRIAMGSTLYSQRRYEYDTAANIRHLADPLNAQGTAGISEAVYDNLDRLTHYQVQGTSLPKTLSFDSQGNILTNSSSYGTDVYQYTSSRPHAVTQIGSRHFDYDANGNMIRDPYRTMTYNAQNQMTRVDMQNGSHADYEYDYTGGRVKKVVSTTDLSGLRRRAETHYLGDSLEVRGDLILLNIFAGARQVATKTLGSVSAISGMGGGTLIDRNIDPVLNFTQLMPWIFILFALFLMGTFRPLDVKLPESLRRRVIVPAHLQKQAWVYFRKKQQWSWMYRELVKSVYLKWRYWAWTIQEMVTDLSSQKWSKALALLLVLVTVLQTSLPARADDGTPLTPASDSDYFYYTHDDHLGSSHLLTEGKVSARHSGLVYRQGDLLQRFEYAPFGQEVFSLNPNLKFDPSYTGQHYDIETGLYYYKARYYNPELARFIQPDTAIQNGKDLQTYNRYTYVRNNPLKYNDPSGHFFFIFIIAAFLGAFLGTMVAIAAVAALALTGLAAAVVGGVIGGVVGGLVSGAITGGLKGALFGALFGGLFGAIGGAVGYGLTQVVGKWGTMAIMGGAGLGLSVAKGGWRGLVIFGAGLAGGVLAGFVGASRKESLAPESGDGPPESQNAQKDQFQQFESSDGLESYADSSRQYAKSGVLDDLKSVGEDFSSQGFDQKSIEVGDMSKADGSSFGGHKSHTTGIDVDVRPGRVNGTSGAVGSWKTSPSYSRPMTQQIVNAFRRNPNVKLIFFNDSAIDGVSPLIGHDDHLHVRFR